MTTVACRFPTMAADTMLSDDNTAFKVQKIRQLEDGTLIGAAGEWSKCYAGIKWFVEGCQGDAPSLQGAQLLFLKPNGEIWMLDNDLPAFPLLDEFAAIGSGAQSAMLSLSKGLSPTEAVKDAISVHPCSNNPVQELHIKEKPSVSRRKRTIR